MPVVGNVVIYVVVVASNNLGCLAAALNHLVSGVLQVVHLNEWVDLLCFCELKLFLFWQLWLFVFEHESLDTVVGYSDSECLVGEFVDDDVYDEVGNV